MIVDEKDRISTVLVGRPDGADWSDVCEDAAKILKEVREEGLAANVFIEKYLTHRRGTFVAIPTGVSFGGGQKARLFITDL